MADNIDEIINNVRKNSDIENKKLAEDIMKNLSESQSQTLQRVLSDKALMNKLLSSDQAKKLMNKLGGDKNGHQ